ncbi:hypothetical protein KP509_12G093800 [Ceratopteris richardii]|nr:hypothetical protein KP509_12G093800 [Ceratopteris richardii]
MQMDSNDTRNLATMDAIEFALQHHIDKVLQTLERINGRLLGFESKMQSLEKTVAGLESAGEKQDQCNTRLIKLESLIEEVNRGVQLLHQRQTLDEAEISLTRLRLDEQKLGLQEPAKVLQEPKATKEEVSNSVYSESPQLPLHPSMQGTSQEQRYYPQGRPPQIEVFSTTQNMEPLPSAMAGPQAPKQSYPPTPVQHTHQQGVQFMSPPSQQIYPQPTHHFPNLGSYSMLPETSAYSHMQAHQLYNAASKSPSGTYMLDSSQHAGAMHAGPQHQDNRIGPQHVYTSSIERVVPLPSNTASSYTQSSMSKTASTLQLIHGGSDSVGYGASYHAPHSVLSSPRGGSHGYSKYTTPLPSENGFPTSNTVSSRPPSRSRFDDVIQKAIGMGFPQEQVLGIVHQLTQNGQTVDFNIVLDKLTSKRDYSQPSRGW